MIGGAEGSVASSVVLILEIMSSNQVHSFAVRVAPMDTLDFVPAPVLGRQSDTLT